MFTSDRPDGPGEFLAGAMKVGAYGTGGDFEIVGNLLPGLVVVRNIDAQTVGQLEPNRRREVSLAEPDFGLTLGESCFRNGFDCFGSPKPGLDFCSFVHGRCISCSIPRPSSRRLGLVVGSRGALLIRAVSDFERSLGPSDRLAYHPLPTPVKRKLLDPKPRFLRGRLGGDVVRPLVVGCDGIIAVSRASDGYGDLLPPLLADPDLDTVVEIAQYLFKRVLNKPMLRLDWLQSYLLSEGCQGLPHERVKGSISNVDPPGLGNPGDKLLRNVRRDFLSIQRTEFPKGVRGPESAEEDGRQRASHLGEQIPDVRVWNLPFKVARISLLVAPEREAVPQADESLLAAYCRPGQILGPISGLAIYEAVSKLAGFSTHLLEGLDETATKPLQHGMARCPGRDGGGPHRLELPDLFVQLLGYS